MRNVVLGVVVVVGVAVAAGCGRTNRPAPSQVTLTGCLLPGDLPDTFRLRSSAVPRQPVAPNGVGEPNKRIDPTGTASQSPTSDEGVADTRIYLLVAAGKKVDLAPYQGSVVRITGGFERGNRERRSEASNPPPATTDQQNAAPGGGSRANPTTGEGPQSSVLGPGENRPEQTVRVTSVNRIARDCESSR